MVSISEVYVVSISEVLFQRDLIVKRMVLDNFLHKVHKVSLNSDNEDNDYDNKDFGNKLSSVVLEEKPKLKKPPLYKVIMLNDDYTPMEFVVEMLQVYFFKTQEQATEIMLHIHQRGLGICGLYTYEIAESKATQVLEKARKNQHPLQIKLEKE